MLLPKIRCGDVQLTIIEMAEEVEVRYVNGKYIREQNYVPSKQSRYKLTPIAKDQILKFVLLYPLLLTPTRLPQPNIVDYLMWFWGSHPNQNRIF